MHHHAVTPIEKQAEIAASPARSVRVGTLRRTYVRTRSLTHVAACEYGGRRAMRYGGDARRRHGDDRLRIDRADQKHDHDVKARKKITGFPNQFGPPFCETVPCTLQRPVT
jgi:hypothetical protein